MFYSLLVDAGNNCCTFQSSVHLVGQDDFEFFLIIWCSCGSEVALSANSTPLFPFPSQRQLMKTVC